MASTNPSTRSRSQTRTGSNVPARPPDAEVTGSNPGRVGIRLGAAVSDVCTPTVPLAAPRDTTGASHTPLAASTARSATAGASPNAATSAAGVFFATSDAVFAPNAVCIRAATP